MSLVTVRELGCKVHGGLGHGRGAALTAERREWAFPREVEAALYGNGFAEQTRDT